MIAVDWGTTRLRAYRLDAAGETLGKRRSDQGVLACQGRSGQTGFGTVLAECIEGWDDMDIVLAGMIGSRNGWFEVPYLDCPAGIDGLAAAMLPMDAPELAGRRLWFVPGVANTPSTDIPDVMRGEETAVVALLEAMSGGTHVICLPGTHSKWVTVHHGAIQSTRTAMTGEVYALLHQHSILGKLMVAEDSRFDAFAFDLGLRRSGEAGGLLHHLFGVRTLGLFDRLSRQALHSYLSGLLIGHEIHAVDLLSRMPRPAQIHLIGNDRLIKRYSHALTALGIGVQLHSEELAAKGLHSLWSRRRQQDASQPGLQGKTA